MVDMNLLRIAQANTEKINKLEDEIAQEWFGCSYDELDEDDRAEVSYEAHDRMEEE